ISSSTFTYTSISSDSNLSSWGFHLIGPVEFEAPPSPDYVPSIEYPPSPDYVPGPEEPEHAPLFPDYVPEPEYPKYLVPSDAEDDDEEEEEQEASKDDDDEEEEHPALADSSTVPVDDPIPFVEDTEAFETDKFAPTPVSSPRRRTSRIFVRPQTPMSADTEALITVVAAALPLSLPPSPLTPLSSPLSQIPSPPLLNRSHFFAPASRFEVEESSAATVTRQAVHALTSSDDMVGDMEERVQTTVEGLSQRVTDLSTTLARDTHEIYVRLEDAQDERAL
ncbi:hypothetical protein Tco_0635650, partial [Tanacetum coccineum]